MHWSLPSCIFLSLSVARQRYISLDGGWREVSLLRATRMREFPRNAVMWQSIVVVVTQLRRKESIAILYMFPSVFHPLYSLSSQSLCSSKNGLTPFATVFRNCWQHGIIPLLSNHLAMKQFSLIFLYIIHAKNFLNTSNLF